MPDIPEYHCKSFNTYEKKSSLSVLYLNRRNLTSGAASYALTRVQAIFSIILTSPQHVVMSAALIADGAGKKHRKYDLPRYVQVNKW